MAEAGDRFGLVGTLVADKYFIERVVGEGGFGIVYRANHRIWDEPVAVKCFTALSNAPVEMREELLEAFVREGKLLTALSSRTTGIVQARDIGTLTTPGGVWLPYMVLEWLDGRPLESWIGHDDGKPRSQERSALETFNLMDGCARALALAHGRGVAHRDIKPANFFVLGDMLAPGVVIKVLDFGIAKVMQSQARTAMQATGTQISSFTPTYGAPEQFDRSYGATGPWTDVHQMALVLVEIMRGGLPALEGEQFIQFAFATQNTQRRPTPRTFGINIGDAVEAVFQKALAVKVVDRYPNMGEFWTGLAAALELKEYPAIQAGETTWVRPSCPTARAAGSRRAAPASCWRSSRS
ncbi:serine/threonine protein kinase [Nannocystis pusilla]|uniref:serine/threonine protein kinase n=1 Tax=Nannocystis pusilla TaxID=889268 RepID=UPI003B7F9F39